MDFLHSVGKESRDIKKYLTKNLELSCGHCGLRNEDCKVCSRCRTVRYCSRNCQVKAFPKHKENCSNIKKLHTEMVKEEKDPEIYSQSVSLFGCHVTYAYKYRGTMAIEMMRSARIEKNDYAYEVALKHFFELLNRDNFDNDYKQEIRNVIPFALIVLGHTQRAYDLIKSWMFQRNQLPCVHFDNDMTEDILLDKQFKDYERTTGETLALLLIKIILIHRLQEGDVEIPHSNLATEVLKIAQENSGYEEFHINVLGRKCRIKQEAMAKQLGDIIIKNCDNILILQALCNPMPLMKEPLDCHLETRCCFIEEARVLIEVALDVFMRKNAISFISDIIGEKRLYTIAHDED